MNTTLGNLQRIFALPDKLEGKLVKGKKEKLRVFHQKEKRFKRKTFVQNISLTLIPIFLKSKHDWNEL